MRNYRRINEHEPKILPILFRLEDWRERESFKMASSDWGDDSRLKRTFYSSQRPQCDS